jgi:hypothetical protein
MLVAFQVRSLLERPKVSREYATKRLSVTRFEKLGTRPFAKLDLLDIERHFDLEHPTEELLTAPQVCNQLIHYYIMFARGGPREFRTLLVASDYKRKESLFEISLGELLNFFALFSREESALSQCGVAVACIWNEKTQDYDFVEMPNKQMQPTQ